MSANTFKSAVATAVEIAADIIRDGAANELTPVDLAAAERALDTTATPAADDVTALCKVAALGVEYLINTDSADSDEEVWVLVQLRDPDDVEADVRWWIRSGGAWR